MNDFTISFHHFETVAPPLIIKSLFPPPALFSAVGGHHAEWIGGGEISNLAGRTCKAHHAAGRHAGAGVAVAIGYVVRRDRAAKNAQAIHESPRRIGGTTDGHIAQADRAVGGDGTGIFLKPLAAVSNHRLL